MKLSDKAIQAIVKLQKQYPNSRSALIPALHLAQHEIGYLPNDIQQQVANLFSIDVNEVQGVVTFYDMFHEKPLGKHILHVCKNASCMLRGCDDILKALCQKLNVEFEKPNQVKTTQDNEFTIIPSECLGACDKAPMMLVDEEVVGPILESDLDSIIKRAKQSPGHPSAVHLKDILDEVH